MKRLVQLVLPAVLCIVLVPLCAQANRTSADNATQSNTSKTKHSSTGDQSAGERKFAQNCGRCHTPPEGFSPHISGTILRHMRVRASLSKQDEEDILHFLNP